MWLGFLTQFSDGAINCPFEVLVGLRQGTHRGHN